MSLIMERICCIYWPAVSIIIMAMSQTVRCVCDNADGCSQTADTTTPSSIDWYDLVESMDYDEVCICVNGKCSNEGGKDSCVCNRGWVGDICNILCECKPGEKCDLSTDEPTCVEAFTDSKLSETMDVQRSYDVCGNYTLRPLKERTCDSGWFCLNGVCVSKGDSTECECDPGATGIQCQIKCCKECQNGECFIHNYDNEEMCNCHLNYSGSNCEIWNPPKTLVIPEPPTWHLWVVGACAFALLLLICLMVIVPYCLWKHRVILVMKVVHYFQDYEDDDDKKWDVFISYTSAMADEAFVVETLFPKLENELGFKTHVHFRDFVAGETILNNIISAVEGSRRTILVISSSFVASEFTKFEYQVAQQEMLKRNHRIIPILLEDITDWKEKMDPALKIILQSVTYIEWPNVKAEKKLEKFWKRIELSMPKKKNRNQQGQP